MHISPTLVRKIAMQVMNQNKPQYNNILHLGIAFHGRFSNHMTGLNLNYCLDCKPPEAGTVHVRYLAQCNPNL